MSCIDTSANLIPFLFMGCWNRDDNPRKNVSDAIRENPITTLVLGGDNVYPEKVRIGNSTNFTKIYSLKTLMNGIHMLYGKTIYAALGNHNIGGPMLNTQIGLDEWNMPDRYYCYNFLDYTLLVIDSNIIEGEQYDTMKSWLEERVNSLRVSGRKYYYVQHDPFMSFKKKKKTVFPKISELLNILVTYPPIAILCADTHNYQKGILDINGIQIPQYVVGTGGADPDYVSTKNGASYMFDTITYTMEKYIAGYGYLEITATDIQFIKVKDWRAFEGIGGSKIKQSRIKQFRKVKIRKTLKIKR
jgi:hypothetical protein